MIEDQLPTSAKPDPPLVSIIMNCYNGEKYLRHALDSVIAQTYTNWEVTFWDNQSTDRSAEIFKSYDDVRFHYFYAPTHTLLYEARNYAIEQASGEFLSFLDVDDWWAPEKLEKQIPLFDDTQVGFVCSKYWRVLEQKKKKLLFRKRRLPSGWILNDLLKNYPVGLLTLMVRRTALDRLAGGFNPNYQIIGDFDLVVQLAFDWKMACIQEPLAFYRVHGENMGSTQNERHINEYSSWVEEHRQDPKIAALPGFSKVQNEVRYMKGLAYLGNDESAQVRSIFRQLPWGMYKLKLWLKWKCPWVIPAIGR